MPNIEYLDDIHQYLVDGVMVPSVTTLTKYALNEDLNNIPKATLEKARSTGSRIHQIIEDNEKGTLDAYSLTKKESDILDEWVDFTADNRIEVKEMENIVFTEDYAGRYDIIADVNDEETLIDIKTNSVYPKEYLEVQMGLYLNAIGKNMPCGCAWFNKKKGSWEYRKVEAISKEKAQEIVECYKRGETSPLTHEIVKNDEIYTPEETALIKEFYTLKEKVEKIEKAREEAMKVFMKENNIKKLENDDFGVTFIEATTRQTIDTAKLKEDGLYDKYLKTVDVKETIRVNHKWRNK